MKSSTLLSILTLAALLSACASTPQQNPPATNATASASDSPKGGAARPLTHEEAQNRVKQVSHVAYELWFGLNAHSDEYEGRTSISFDLRPKAKDHGKDIFVDFYGGTLHSIIVNGTTLPNPAERFDGNRIRFDVSEFQPGANRIEIAFVHGYSENGHGLYRFKDPEDGRVYLYTDDEPFFAHQIFPCFDQPDLKATYELTVAAPESWVIVTNTLERDVSNVDGKKVWSFPASPLISTYLFALIAGDYASWKSDAGGIPLRLFARQALKPYVDSKEWFDITRKGLDFYGVQFGYPYPFGKYDQILVPDFDEGAMENAGAVTFTERFVYRTKMPQRKHMRRANVILHEMSHMWFGDLVTMKWWNGLWLNESFADFMAAWSVDSATWFKGAWQDFFFDDKGWAYWQDELATTHPIELPVPDTDHAFSNFDGITYGKGASVIKQLRYYLGEEDFREGLQRYFQKYAFHNSTLADFMGKLSEASGKDLKAWQEPWLTTQGMNTVQTEWACGNDQKISKFAILQGNAPQSSTLRPHSAEVALFYSKNGKFNTGPKDVLQVNFSKDRTEVPEAIGKPCPEFVYPNYQDQDYVKVQLDPVSLKNMVADLKHIEDPLVREMAWAALYNSVVDGVLSAKEYVTTAVENLRSEKDLYVLPQLFNSMVESPVGWDSVFKYIDPKEREPLYSDLEKVCLDQLKAAPAGSDLQLVWFDGFTASAHTPQGLEFARNLLTRKAHLSGFKVDQDVRWTLVRTLARGGAPDAKDLIAAEYKADSTHFGKTNELQALAQIPTQSDKMDWIGKIEDAGKTNGATKDLSSSDINNLMRSLPTFGQDGLIDGWVDRYFAYLPQAARSANEEYMSSYMRSLYPGTCSPKVIDLTKQALDGKLPAVALKELKTHLQEEERCLKARAVSSQPQQRAEHSESNKTKS